jgi:hypothetical protein
MRQTADTYTHLPEAFKLLRQKMRSCTKPEIVEHIRPFIEGLGYRPRNMSGPPFDYEADRALKTLLHEGLVCKQLDGWALTEKGATRPIEITPEEASAMVRRRIKASG